MKSQYDKEELNQMIIKYSKSIFNILIGGFFMLAKACLVGLLGWGLFFVILIINKPLGVWYAIFGACAVSGLLWTMLPNPYKAYIGEVNNG